MKVEIDLNNILGDEYGAETLQESVRRQVIDSITRTIKEGVGKKIDSAVSSIINQEVAKALQDKMPSLVEDVLSGQYRQVDRWGDSKNEVTTFRQEIVKSINENMKYEKRQYSSDRNAFTQAIDAVIEKNIAEFKVEFSKQVDAGFTKDAISYASTELAKRLGIKL